MMVLMYILFRTFIFLVSFLSSTLSHSTTFYFSFLNFNFYSTSRYLFTCTLFLLPLSTFPSLLIQHTLLSTFPSLLIQTHSSQHFSFFLFQTCVIRYSPHDWTLPALSPGATYLQRTGDIVYPVRRSKILSKK